MSNLRTLCSYNLESFISSKRHIETEYKSIECDRQRGALDMLYDEQWQNKALRLASTRKKINWAIIAESCPASTWAKNRNIMKQSQIFYSKGWIWVGTNCWYRGDSAYTDCSQKQSLLYPEKFNIGFLVQIFFGSSYTCMEARKKICAKNPMLNFSG